MLLKITIGDGAEDYTNYINNEERDGENDNADEEDDDDGSYMGENEYDNSVSSDESDFHRDIDEEVQLNENCIVSKVKCYHYNSCHI